MRKTNRGLTLIGMLLVTSTPALAQLEVGGDLLDNCGDIDALQSAGEFVAARDKAVLCLEGLEQELLGEIGQFFLTEIAGWTRVSYEESQMFGFTNVAASYEKGDISVDVNLTGTGGGGAGAGLGGLFGGIAQNALLQTGQQVTVGGIPSVLQNDGSLMVPIGDGSFLNFSSSDLDSPDEALAGMGDLINDFPVADINAALQ